MNILVVCSGNICRSPMGEGILVHLLAERGITDHHVRSAGTMGIVGVPPADDAIQVCRERGIDIAAQRSAALTPALTGWADLVLCMAAHHRRFVLRYREQDQGVLLLGRFDPAGGREEIEDPVGMHVTSFRACRDRLWACTTALLDQLT